MEIKILGHYHNSTKGNISSSIGGELIITALDDSETVTILSHSHKIDINGEIITTSVGGGGTFSIVNGKVIIPKHYHFYITSDGKNYTTSEGGGMIEEFIDKCTGKDDLALRNLAK
jgi:hypothetical protein